MSTRRALVFSFLDRYASLVLGIASSIFIARLLTRFGKVPAHQHAPVLAIDRLCVLGRGKIGSPIAMSAERRTFIARRLE